MNTLNMAAGPGLDSLKLNGAVSAAIGLVCLAVAAAIWFFGNKHTPRFVVLLIMTGMAGMVGTPLGAWMRHAVAWANDTAAKITTRWTGAAVTGLLAGLAVYVLAIRMKDNKVDRVTLGTAAVTPVAVASIPGPVGAAAYSVVTAITSVVGWAIGQALNLN